MVVGNLDVLSLYLRVELNIGIAGWAWKAPRIVVVASELFGDEITLCFVTETDEDEIDSLAGVVFVVGPIKALDYITICFVTETDEGECSLDKHRMSALCVFDD